MQRATDGSKTVLVTGDLFCLKQSNHFCACSAAPLFNAINVNRLKTIQFAVMELKSLQNDFVHLAFLKRRSFFENGKHAYEVLLRN